MLLSINQLWELTGRDRKTITKHLEKLPLSQAVCQLNCADIARRFPLFVSDKFW